MNDDHLDKRDKAIANARAEITEAMGHLGNAVNHAYAINDQVHVSLLSSLIKQLSAIRQPLIEHAEWLANERRR